MGTEDMNIRQMAEAAGVDVETVRFLQRRGLVPEPPKPPQGFTIAYTADNLSQLRFVRRAQAIGFTIDEVRTLLRLREAPDSCKCARGMAEEKLAEVREKRAALELMEAELQALVSTCDAPEDDGRCPALRLLYDGTTAASAA